MQDFEPDAFCDIYKLMDVFNFRFCRCAHTLFSLNIEAALELIVLLRLIEDGASAELAAINYKMQRQG